MAFAGDPFYKQTGKRIQGCRIRKDLTQEDLGQRLAPPVKRASIANVESGKQRLLLHTFVQIAEILGCEMRELLPADAGRAHKDITTEVTAELERLKMPNRAVQRISRQLVANWPRAAKK